MIINFNPSCVIYEIFWTEEICIVIFNFIVHIASVKTFVLREIIKSSFVKYENNAEG